MGRLAATFRRAEAAHREALAHLAAAREAVRHGVRDGEREGERDGDPAVERLDRRLIAQRERFTHLGRAIGRHVGSRPVPASDVDDPGHAARLAWQRADEADIAMTEAEQLAQRAPLLPGLSPASRNLVVYLACALVSVAAQYALLVLADVTQLGTAPLLTWMCAGLPAMAFLAGYLVISAWGRPRLAFGDRPRHPFLGLAICLLAMPAAYAAYKIALWLG